MCVSLYALIWSLYLTLLHARERRRPTERAKGRQNAAVNPGARPSRAHPARGFGVNGIPEHPPPLPEPGRSQATQTMGADQD